MFQKNVFYELLLAKTQTLLRAHDKLNWEQPLHLVDVQMHTPCRLAILILLAMYNQTLG